MAKLMRCCRRTAIPLALLLISAPALAQRGPGPRMPTYDPDAETTVSGTVTKIQEVNGTHGWKGLHLWLESANKTYEVHLGPVLFLEDLKLAPAVGDELQITGSVSVVDEVDTLIAREVVRRAETFELRDERGRPLWRRNGRRSRT